jgi:hypothetical protein
MSGAYAKRELFGESAERAHGGSGRGGGAAALRPHSDALEQTQQKVLDQMHFRSKLTSVPSTLSLDQINRAMASL